MLPLKATRTPRRIQALLKAMGGRQNSPRGSADCCVTNHVAPQHGQSVDRMRGHRASHPIFINCAPRQEENPFTRSARLCGTLFMRSARLSKSSLCVEIPLARNVRPGGTSDVTERYWRAASAYPNKPMVLTAARMMKMTTPQKAPTRDLYLRPCFVSRANICVVTQKPLSLT